MFIRQTILITLFLIGSVLLSSGGAAAKERDPGKGSGKAHQARLTWSIPRLEQSLTPGQNAEVNVTITSSVDLNGLTLWASGGLREVVKIEPATLAILRAGVATPVKLTIAMPMDGAHSMGGVIQVRAGQRNLPSALKLKLTVPGTSDEREDDEK